MDWLLKVLGPEPLPRENFKIDRLGWNKKEQNVGGLKSIELEENMKRLNAFRQDVANFTDSLQALDSRVKKIDEDEKRFLEERLGALESKMELRKKNN